MIFMNPVSNIWAPKFPTIAFIFLGFNVEKCNLETNVCRTPWTIALCRSMSIKIIRLIPEFLLALVGIDLHWALIEGVVYLV